MQNVVHNHVIRVSENMARHAEAIRQYQAVRDFCAYALKNEAGAVIEAGGDGAAVIAYLEDVVAHLRAMARAADAAGKDRR